MSDFKFIREHLKCFGGIGAFTSGFDNPTSVNREYSTFYVAFIPEDVLILDGSEKIERIFEIRDSVLVRGKEEEEKISELKLFMLHELVSSFIQNPDQYADGISRILLRLINEPSTMMVFENFINQYNRAF